MMVPRGGIEPPTLRFSVFGAGILAFSRECPLMMTRTEIGWQLPPWVAHPIPESSRPDYTGIALTQLGEVLESASDPLRTLDAYRHAPFIGCVREGLIT